MSRQVRRVTASITRIGTAAVAAAALGLGVVPALAAQAAPAARVAPVKVAAPALPKNPGGVGTGGTATAPGSGGNGCAGGGCSNANDDGGSGGGGSSHAAPSLTNVSFSQAAGGQAASVTITYTALAVTTSFLPDGEVGVGYSTTLAAAGGTTPLTWTLSGGSLPDGLKLSDGGTISGTPQAGGTFNFSVQVTDSGSPQQTATQSFTIFIAKAGTLTELAIDPSMATVGDTITLSADILADPGGGPLPGGTVTFTANGSTVCNNVPATGGFALCTINLNTAGTYSITANYPGDSNYTGSSDTNSTYQVRKAGARPGLSVAPTSGATVDSSLTLTVTLQTNGAADPPTGTVTFDIDGVPVSGCGAELVVAQKAVCDVPAPLPAGTYTIDATYNGDSEYVSTETQITGYKVGQAAPAVTLSASPSSGATTANSISLTANVSGNNGAPAATGTVQFTVNGSTVSGCASVTVTSGSASCSVGTLNAGTYTLKAIYSGDTNFSAGSDTVTGYQVQQANATMEMSASPDFDATVATPVTITANLSGPVGAPAPTGTVTFHVDGSVPSGCANVKISSGAATCDAGDLSAGFHNFTSDYSGDSVYGSANAGIFLYPVAQATPGVSLSATPAGGALVTDPVSLSATVVPVAGGPAPTGTVTFLVNGTAPAGCTNVSLSSATCAVGQLPAGTYTFDADYSGDTNYVATSDTVSDYVVDKLTSKLVISSNPGTSVWGQPVTFTATVTVSPIGTPITAGTVQWTVNGTPVGSPVPVGADGTATLGPLTNLLVGADDVLATYSGTDQNSFTESDDQFVVGKAATSTTIAVTSKKLTATVTPVAPGSGQPTGPVTFTVNGTTVGTANLSAKGVATLAFKSSGAEVASASYGGDDHFTGSTTSTSTRNPVITAKITSAHPKTKLGWYRAAVTITFTCKAGSAPLKGTCPHPVTLGHSAAAQTVSRTVSDTDGGIAMITVSPINIDLKAPVVKVNGIKNGATYDAPGPSKITCEATDALSGLASPCALKVVRGPLHITWTAKASDKAGNTTTVSGKASLTDFFVAGVPKVNGFYQVKIGGSYMVEAFVVTTKAPHYVFAAPLGVQPHPVGPAMTKIGTDLWAIQINITHKMSKHKFWTLGVKVGTTVHLIHIQLHS